MIYLSLLGIYLQLIITLLFVYLIRLTRIGVSLSLAVVGVLIDVISVTVWKRVIVLELLDTLLMKFNTYEKSIGLAMLTLPMNSLWSILIERCKSAKHSNHWE